MLSVEEYKEIEDAFLLFDKDGSGTIDVGELKDALRVLGVNLNLNETRKLMEQADKDGSGSIELEEFMPLMLIKLSMRDNAKEISKAFKMYDDDDNGRIEAENLNNAASALGISVSREELNEMILIADFKNQGYVDLMDFEKVMEQGGQYKKKDDLLSEANVGNVEDAGLKKVFTNLIKDSSQPSVESPGIKSGSIRLPGIN